MTGDVGDLVDFIHHIGEILCQEDMLLVGGDFQQFISIHIVPDTKRYDRNVFVLDIEDER